jgi:hypothetical protein
MIEKLLNAKENIIIVKKKPWFFITGFSSSVLPGSAAVGCYKE